ncbi:MAG: transketolase [Nitrospirae bacterium]|nr:MAG: transketolase [Nitrospirota bacterium]
MPTNVTIEDLQRKSHWLRQELFELVMRRKKGHLPSSYSCAEMVIALMYGGYIRGYPSAPRHPDRDRLIVSKGHAAMVLYPILADLGYFPNDELDKFATPEGRLRLYADHTIPGIETITGSLGHGLGIGCGYAYAAKQDGKDARTFVLLSDGECYEGSVWEAAMFAAHHRLDNLIVIVDRNGLCILDRTEACVKLDPLDDKWRAFGWEVLTVDGHAYRSILPALDRAVAHRSGRPMAIVSHSVKGKGISFMEHQALWHNTMPNEDQMQQARRELLDNCIDG